MRRIISAVLAACFTLSVAVVALADTRVIVYPNQNPTSTEQNSNAQFARISVGSFERDALGLTGAINSTTGTYANLTISPGTGLFVTVAPTSTTVGAGTVYQMGQNDPNPLPTGGFTPALAASTTKILLAGQQTATTTPMGPLTAPGGGQSVYYLIETQLVSQDANPQSMAFVSNNGVKTFQSVNTNRNDAIVYQVKAGTPSGSPTQPTVDTGWIAVGYILVPNGKTQILTGDISMSPPLSGFVQNSNVVHVSPAASPSPDSGNAAVSGTIAGNQVVSKVATGTPPLIVSSTTQVANLNAATAGTLSPLPTPTASAPITLTGTWPNQTIACATCVTSVTGSGNVSTTGGTTPVVTVTAAPTFNNLTVSNTTTLSALASGCLQVNGSGVVSTTACSAGGGITSVSGTAPIVSSGGSTPAISCSLCVTLSPGAPQTGTIALSAFTATSAICADASKNLTSTCTSAGPVYGNVTDSALTSGRCVQASTAGLLANAAAGCATTGTSKTALVIERAITGTLTVTTSAPFPLPSGATGITTVNDQFQCLTAGSGTSTVKWQTTTTADPTTATWADITGSSFSWTTAGGAFNGTPFSVSLAGITFVRANVTAVGGTAPQNCFFYLHGTQTIQ